MKVQVLGTGGGCAPCKAMLRNVELAIAELGLPTQVEYVTQIQQMVALRITGSPALVVDGVVKSMGRALDLATIKTILLSAGKEASK